MVDCTSWEGDSGCAQVEGCPDYCVGLTSATLHAGGDGCTGQSVLSFGVATKADGGGGRWYWDGNMDKSLSNYGTLIDPDKAFTPAAQNDGTGGGAFGLWVRQYDPHDLCDVRWFGVFPGAAAGTNSVNFQYLLDSVGTPDFVVGAYDLEGDLEYSTACKLRIRTGAHVIIDAGRITPKVATCTDIDFVVDGKLQQTGTISDPSAGKFDWTVITDPGDGVSKYAIRGFIEFGGYEAVPASGFKLTGTGVIWGTWTGTPEAFSWSDMPYKGACTIFANDVYIGGGLEWYGFLAECVYNETQTTYPADNVVFDNNYVHDCSFNGLNFNFASESTNCVIKNNRTDTCYQGVELSGGDCLTNVIKNSYGRGIITGGGKIAWDVNIIGNTIIDTHYTNDWTGVGILAIDSAGAASLSNMIIKDNMILRCDARGIEVAAETGSVTNNTIQDYFQDPNSTGSGGSANPSNAMYIYFRGRAIVNNNTFIIDSAAVISGHMYLGGPETFGFNNCIYTDAEAYNIEIDASADWTDPIPPSYKIITPINFSGQGHKTTYTGTATPDVSGDSFDFASAGGFGTGIDVTGAQGQYQIATNTTGSMANVIIDTLVCTATGTVRPGGDGTQDLGSTSYKWKDIYATNATIITSDERAKQQIAELTTAEKAVATKLKKAIRTFKRNDAVELKGSEARTHVGIIAQEVITIFASEGLDATQYGILCFDKWEAKPKSGSSPAVEAGEQYSIRYEELLAFIISAL